MLSASYLQHQPHLLAGPSAPRLVPPPAYWVAPAWCLAPKAAWVRVFLPSLLSVPGARLTSWQASVAQELQQERRTVPISIPLEHSEVCTREASSEPQLLFSKPRMWLGATRSRSALFSEPRSQSAPKSQQRGDRGVPRANSSGAARPQWLCPAASVARLSVAFAARSSGSPLAGPPRRGSRCAARPLRPPAVCARGRSGAAGQREPQSAPARRPAGMLRYSSGLTVTATTPRRTAGDGGRARRKVRGATGGGRRGGPSGRAVGRCDPSRSVCGGARLGLLIFGVFRWSARCVKTSLWASVVGLW